MRGRLKANTVDKYLYPVRKQIVELVQPGADVIEYGCGNGDLLFKLSTKINSGIGIDNSNSLIAFALNRKKNEGVENINFKLLDLNEESFSQSADCSIASLFFHVVPREKSIELLEKMINTSETAIVCGFSAPQNWKQNLLLWIDQRFSGHYSYFKEYKENNYMEGLLSQVKGISYSCYDTFDAVIKIYKINKH